MIHFPTTRWLSNSVRYICFMLAGSAVLATLAAASHAADSRPNILWISTEDISPDLGCYGDDYAKTPNLDAFAKQGVLFRYAFSHAGVCAPTRSGIITGMYPTTIGSHHMRSSAVPPPYVKCFPEYLRAAGYYCTNNVKTDYNFPSPPTAWDESSSKAHWRNRPEGMPFFSVINLIMTHESKIRASEKEFAQLTRRLTPADRHDPARAQIPPYYPDTPIVRNDWARYYDLITAMDLRVAEILAELEEDGLADNTIVFFWGDHGRGLPRAKRWIYDSGIRVPLLVRWPRHVKPGSVREDLVCFLDLAPTVLALAGVKVPEHFQGQVILGPQQAPPREYIFAARDRMDETYDIIRCVRDKQFKYIRNYEACKPYAQYIDYMEEMPTMQEMRRLNARGKLTGAQKLFFLPEKPAEELYDITRDPHEVNNLAGDAKYADVLNRMRGVQEQWTKDTGDLGLVPEDELKERMRPGGRWQTTADPVLKRDGDQVVVECPTQGASINYRLSGGRWQLYTGPISAALGTKIEAQACRIGYKDSKVVASE